MGAKQTVKTKNFRKVIRKWGLTPRKKKSKGSHEQWIGKGMTRPVTFQATQKEIPFFVLKNNLETIGKTVEEFFETLSSL